MNALYRVFQKLVNEELEKQKETDQKVGYRWRPEFHVAPPTGWLNDPNGLCQKDGIYHAFFQMAPFEPEGGLKFWGHCISKDMLHWEFQGVPMQPDQPYDCHGAYSGSALVEEDRMYLFYTGNIKQAGDYNYITDGRESNTILAVSRDGGKIESKKLLMTNADYPEDLTCHVRDPKVWKQDGMYYMVQGARTKEEKGVVLVFASEDKYHWNCIHRLESKETFGYMWECPDLYELDGQTILGISPQGVEADGYWYANRYQTVTAVIRGDFRTDGVPEHFRELDGGFDFYAPQTFLTEDGRRILIGWMGMADAEDEYTNRTVEDNWQNVLTLARELSLKDGIVCQNPVRELENWWNREEAFTGQYEGSTTECYELDLKPGTGDVKVTLADGLVLFWDSREYVFKMEFTDSALGCGRTVRARQMQECADMKVIVDVSCVEVFMNGGKDVFSTRFYPAKDQYKVVVNGTDLDGFYRYRE